ncbi:MAG: NADH-quinone oxidoreductase subunit L, partial [Candidatus Binatia bacterium]
GLLGALITSIYTFRMVFITFFGEAKQRASKRPGARIQVPLVILALLTIAGGFFGLPEFLHSALPALPHGKESAVSELALETIAAVSSLLGIAVAYVLFLRYRGLTDKLIATAAGNALQRYWFSGWGFDWLYDTLFVRPYVWAARANKSDIVEQIYRIITDAIRACYAALSATQTGQLRWYAKAIAAGAAVVVAIMVFL